MQIMNHENTCPGQTRANWSGGFRCNSDSQVSFRKKFNWQKELENLSESSRNTGLRKSDGVCQSIGMTRKIYIQVPQGANAFSASLA